MADFGVLARIRLVRDITVISWEVNMCIKFDTHRALLALVWVSALLIQPASAVDFPGINTGAIPDNNTNGRNVSFFVSGMNDLGDVKLSMSLFHTFIEDLDVELIAPSQVARRTIFSLTGRQSLGTDSNAFGTYVFDDHATTDWWLAAAAANGGNIPSGSYRISTAGNFVSSNKTGGCVSTLSYAFNQLNAGQINGVWTLRLVDHFAPDQGSISSATLSLEPAGERLFSSGFDAPMRGSCVRAQSDYTGSNRSSYAVTRDDPVTGVKTWFIKDNDDSNGFGFIRQYQLGATGDVPVGGDFDGDGIWDPAVWTPASGHYTMLLSSRLQLPPVEFDFGNAASDAHESGDYDGDGITDVAHFTSSPSPQVDIRLSSDGSVRSIGVPSANFVAGGMDVNGDGIADIASQSFTQLGIAYQFYSGADGQNFAGFGFGQGTGPYMILGNFTGSDTKADLALVKGGWTTWDAATQFVQNEVVFTPNNAMAGDFDGDGVEDYAVWNDDSNGTGFMVRPTSDPNNPVLVPFGVSGDYALERVRAH